MVTALSEQAVVTDWPTRLLLTGATALVIVLALLLLRRGWRRRGNRQEWAPLPEVIQSSALADAISGKYIGTVRAGDWLDRIVAGGAMARSAVSPTKAGLLLDREGEPALLIPAAKIEAVETAPGMLQKVFGGHGIVAVTWIWGQSKVVTGIWFADPADQQSVIGWIDDYVGKPPEAPVQREDS